jgi:inosine/xanthosine triphosphate pyrophosphatase family protein
MTHKLLMATANPHKSERFKYYLKDLGLSVVDLVDIKRELEIVEDGKTPEENALKKARAGFEATGMPAFGVDYWFYIKGLADKLQPGPNVRRIFVGKNRERVEATDEEMLAYYAKIIADLGGETTGLWISAIALVTPNGEFTQRFERQTLLTSEINSKRTLGEPLNSIQIDPKTGKYFTDLSKDDWLALQAEREKGYIDFIEEHLAEL